MHQNVERLVPSCVLRAGAVAATALLATGLTVGCDRPAHTPDVPGLTTNVPFDYPAGPPSPCERPVRLEARDLAVKRQATHCAAAITDGTVALVIFDGISKTKDELDTVADQVETLVGDYTDDLVHVQVDAVEATPAAEETLAKAWGGKSCFDFKDHASPAAEVADQAMPGLQKYDFLLAMTPRGNCNFALMGYTFGGRYADIYGSWLFLLPAKKEALSAPAAATIGHELLHEVGLRHAGILEGGMPLAFGGEYNLHDLANTAVYNELGKPDGMMGNNVYLKSNQPDPVQVEYLRWPQIVSGAKPHAIRMDGEELSLTSTTYDGEFFVLPLQAGVSFKDEDGSSSPLFDNVAIVPYTGADGMFVGARVCFVRGSQVVSANGGRLVPAMRDSSNKLILNDGTRRIEVEIGVGGSTVVIRQLS